MPEFIRQLEGQLIRCATAPTELTSRVAPEWIHVFPAVLFSHWLIGRVDPSAPLLDLLVHNNNRYDGDLVIDYNHASVDDPENAIAAGFSGEMERREDGIWAKVKEWTDKARAGIESGEWRYISPTWYLAAWSRHDDSWIGPAWHSIALTNNPQIDGMNEVPDRVAAAASKPGRHLSLPRHVFLPNPASATPPRSQDLLFIPPFAARAATPNPTPEPSGADDMNLPLLLAALSLAADFDLAAEDADEQLASAATALASSSTAAPGVPPELLTALEVEAPAEGAVAACLSRVAVLKASAVDPQAQGKLLAENIELRAAARVRDANLAPAAVPHALNLARAVQQEGDPADKAFGAFLAAAPRLPRSVQAPAVKDDPKGLENPAPATAASLTPQQKSIAKQLGLSEEKYAAAMQQPAK